MPDSKSRILERIKQFETDIEKATVIPDLKVQHSNLKNLYLSIISYLDTQVRNANGSSDAVKLVIDAIQLVKQEQMIFKFIQDPTEKELRAGRIQIQNIKWALRRELIMFKEYVATGLIVANDNI